jgi:hypothetical protein
VGAPIGPGRTSGAGTSLAQAAAAAATELFVGDVTPFAVGVRISLGTYPSADVKSVRAIDAASNKLTLVSPISRAYPVGAEVVPTTSAGYGVGTMTTAVAASGANRITVQEAGMFAVGATVAIGPRPSADVKQVSAVDAATNQYTLSSALSKEYPAGTIVTPDNDTALRNVDWVGALVRHEIAHSVDSLINCSGFYAEGGWDSTDDFESWAAAMGNPWSTNDRSVISAADRTAIKNHIVAAKGNNSPRALNHGLPAGHAINRYWNKDVPVIEAAKPCIARAQQFWTQPETLKQYGAKYFTINTYYAKFQSYNQQVHTQRVRSYQLFSPAEFFAEIYTVYYEEAGRVPEADLGRLVPVGGWRDWIRNNVHNRGLAASPAAPAALPAPSVGAKAGRDRS